MKINKYFPFAAIYFFVNTLGLPFGLSYTTLLGPVFYLWVVSVRRKEILWPYLLVAGPFAAVQIANGVDFAAYLPAILNTTCVYIFCQAFYTFLIHSKDVRGVFRTIFIVNFFMCILGVITYFTDYVDILWITQFLTPGVPTFLRFRMFAYEASIYATQFTPLFLYWYMRSSFGYSRAPKPLMAAMLALPLLISFSMGVISCILIALILESIFLFRYFSRMKKFWRTIFLFGTGVTVAVMFVMVFFPNNVLFHRLDNVVGGKDLSGNGRTSEAFYLANKVLGLKNVFFGIGPGQLRIIGGGIIRGYYNYPEDFAISIPNAVADTMMAYGYLGLVLRLGAEIVLFFATRVWNNYYRLALFLFIFVYQFTGSYSTNQAEFVIWILAFTNCFPEFNFASIKKLTAPIQGNEQIGYPQST